MVKLRFTIGVLGIAILSSVYGNTNRSKDQRLESKKDFIKKMMKEAWDTYTTHAWGDHSVTPTTQRADYHGGVPGKSKCGAIIIAAMDTLHIMGLHEEFDRAKDWVMKDLNFSSVEAQIYQSDIVGVHISGLLSAFFLTNEQIFLQRAQELAVIDLASFNPSTGIPHILFNLATKRVRQFRYVSEAVSTLTLGKVCSVFNSLANLTGDGRFKEKAERLRAHLQLQQDGLLPDYITVDTGSFSGINTTAASIPLMSTFLNEWLQYGDKTAKRRYENMADAILRNGLIKTSHKSQLRYVSSRSSSGIVVNEMTSKACMAAGVFALGATSDLVASANSTNWLRLGEEIAETCYFVSNKTASGLAPYQFEFNLYMEGEASAHSETNALDPHLAYSYFVLYRLTGNAKYRQWGWQMVKAIQNSARVSRGGYGKVVNVKSPHLGAYGSQPIPLLGGTLKFLYLLFCDSDYFSLDDWVYDVNGNLMPTSGGSRSKTHTTSANVMAGRSSGSIAVLYVVILIVFCVAVAFAWKRYWRGVKAVHTIHHTGMFRGLGDTDDDASQMVYGRL